MAKITVIYEDHEVDEGFHDKIAKAMKSLGFSWRTDNTTILPVMRQEITFEKDE